MVMYTMLNTQEILETIYIAWTIGNGDSMHAGYLAHGNSEGEVRGRSRHENNGEKGNDRNKNNGERGRSKQE